MTDIQFLNEALEKARSIENEFLDMPNSKLTNMSKNDSMRSNFMSKKPSITNYGIEKSLSNITNHKNKHPKVRSTSKNGGTRSIFNAPQKDQTSSQNYMSVISSLTF